MDARSRVRLVVQRKAHRAVAFAVVLASAAIGLIGCRRAEKAATAPQDHGGPAASLTGFVASHRGDQAVLFWLDGNVPGLRASVVEFAAQRERVIRSARFIDTGTWSPDDRLFAGAEALEAGKREAGILEAATLKWRPIRTPTAVPVSSSYFPLWSPDGMRILFDGAVDVDMRDFQWVFVYAVATQECVPLAVGTIRRSRDAFWQDRFVFALRCSDREERYAGLPRYRFFTRPLARGG